MQLYILRNIEGMYWGKDNKLTPYANAAKLYSLEDAQKAASRKGCFVYIDEAEVDYIDKSYSHFIKEKHNGK